MVDAHTGTGTIDTCHNNKLYATSLNSSYNDPRFRTEYLVTRDMKCVKTSTFCYFHTANMVLQPSNVAFANTETYYPYYKCQENCDAGYYVLANGTCVLGAYCGANGLSDSHVAVKTIAAINTHFIYMCKTDPCLSGTNSLENDVFYNPEVLTSDATNKRWLVCNKPSDSTTVACPINRIAIYITKLRESNTAADYLSWIGVCELIDKTKLYEKHQTLKGLY